MGWGQGNPRAILHIDGDGFFAACEVALNPSLRGKCVVTGAERGIASAMTYEAKARGVKRGMPLHEIRRVCPEAIILPANHETYSIFAVRMYAIVRRYTSAVEEYGIDECFADITGLRRPLHMTYEEIARAVKRDLSNELGITFSVGLAPNKVLAKIGSKWQKPDGFTHIRAQDRVQGSRPNVPFGTGGSPAVLHGKVKSCTPPPEGTLEYFLSHTPCEKVWGIGPQTAALLAQQHVMTALDLARKDEVWVKRYLTKPHHELWRELRGEFVLPLNLEAKHNYQSIQKTQTFSPPSNDQSFLLSELSKNCENACSRARRHKLFTRKVSFFLKTQTFRYRWIEVKLSHYTALPTDLMKVVQENFSKLFRTGEQYRTTGVTLHDLTDSPPVQRDLFGAFEATTKASKVFERVDALCARYGKHIISLGSSFSALHPHSNEDWPLSGYIRGQSSVNSNSHPETRLLGPTSGSLASKSHAFTRPQLKGETIRQHLVIPLLGSVQ